MWIFLSNPRSLTIHSEQVTHTGTLGLRPGMFGFHTSTLFHWSAIAD